MPMDISKKLLECDICLRKFNDKSNLKQHTRIHTGEKPYECGICHKTFTQKHTLTSHNLIHTGEKPYECSFCLKKFKVKSYLTMHEKIHAGNKSFKCTLCTKNFDIKAYLTRHEKIHSDEKRYRCDLTTRGKVHNTVRMVEDGKIGIKEEVDLNQDFEDHKDIFSPMQTTLVKKECKIEIEHHEILLQDLKQFKVIVKEEEEEY